MKLFQKYWDKLKIEELDLQELRVLVDELKSSYVAKKIELPYINIHSRKDLFLGLVYSLDIVDSAEMYHLLSSSLQYFYDNLVEETEDRFFDEINAFMIEKERKRKEKEENSKSFAKQRKPVYKNIWELDTVRNYHLSHTKKSRYEHKKHTIAGKLDEALYIGGYVNDIAEKCVCSSKRVISHYYHLRRDLRLDGKKIKEEKGVYLKIQNEGLTYE